VTQPEIYLCALASNLCFAAASIYFTKYTKKYSSIWMNQVKSTVAFFAFCAAWASTESFFPISVNAWASFIFSGFMGLCVADIYMFRSYATLGPARSLVLFSFQPFILASYGYFILGQTISKVQLISILMLFSCFGLLVMERSKLHGKWDIKSFVWAFFGVVFDAVGIIFTRNAFEHAPGVGPFQANATRIVGALLGFLIINPRSYKKMARDFRVMLPLDRVSVIGASLIGTFLALALYLTSLKYAHLASLSCVNITAPVVLAAAESIRERKWPSVYLVCGLILFAAAILVLSFY